MAPSERAASDSDGGGVEQAHHRVDRLLTGEDVTHRRRSVAGSVPGPGTRLVTGVHRNPTVEIDDRNLAKIASGSPTASERFAMATPIEAVLSQRATIVNVLK
jgi:hypothetical protein